VYNFAKTGNNLELLLTGKVTLEYKSVIEKMQQMGLALPVKYYTDSYLSNNNTNKNFEFILNSLK